MRQLKPEQKPKHKVEKKYICSECGKKHNNEDNPQYCEDCEDMYSSYGMEGMYQLD